MSKNPALLKMCIRDSVMGVPGLHIEVKRTERFSLYDALAPAKRDAAGSENLPVVMHRRNESPWVVVMDFHDFIQIYRCLLYTSLLLDKTLVGTTGFEPAIKYLLKPYLFPISTRFSTHLFLQDRLKDGIKGIGNLGHFTFYPVSYPHLDVYKRQRHNRV